MVPRPPFLLLAAASLVLLPSLSLSGPVTLYVSTEGSDVWSGQRPTPRGPDGPFATLTRARDELRKLNAAGQLRDGAVVRVAAGEYVLLDPFTISSRDSGSEAGPIVYQAMTEAKPVLRAAQVVPGFTKHKGQIFKADLRSAALADREFGQVFVGNRRQVLARYPNFDARDPHGGTWAHVASVEGKENYTEFHYGEDETHGWAHPQDGSVPIFGGRDWAFRIVPLLSHDPEQRKITLRSRTWCALAIGDRYYVRGLFEELDAPGEWYRDPRSQVLYLWPDQPLGLNEARVPMADEVVRFDGAAHVTLKGFVLEMCRQTAVRMTDCTHCLVAGCEIRNAGGWGVAIAGGSHTGAAGNDVHSCGHGGISVDGGDRRTLAPGHNFADNNYVHHCANLWLTYRPGVAVRGVGNRLSHNMVHDMPHAGILLSGNENMVEFNVVRHVNLQSADTGGIYFCSRDWTQRNNVIRYNIFHHCGGFGKKNSWRPLANGRITFTYPHFTWGIYLDDPTTGTRVYGNILYDVPMCALHNHGGRDNVWENNILVDAPAQRAGQLSPNWSEWPKILAKLQRAREPGSPYLGRYPELAKYAHTHPEEMTGLRFIRNIVYYTRQGTQWLRGHQAKSWGGPETQLLYSLNMRPYDFERNEWDYNCIWAEPGLDLRIALQLKPNPASKLTWPQWRALGPDAHSVLADPGFVDPANRDFRLKPDSPALALGFKPIPIDRIGPHNDPLRASWPIKQAPGVADLGELHTTRYYQPPGYRRLPAKDFVRRSGCGRFFAKARAGKPVTVAYFGGGIHPPNGWRKTVVEWLRARSEQLRLVDASICDCVRGSGFSVYRFQREVLSNKPDLVFVDFASDDHSASPDAVMRTTEALLRQARKSDPTLDVVLLYAFRSGYEQDYADGLLPCGVSAYERVAAHYACPSINMGCRVAQLYRAGKLLITTAGDETPPDGKLVFSRGAVRPLPDANRIYAEAIIAGLAAMEGDRDASPHPLPRPRLPDNYERARLVPITRSMLEGQWEQLAPNYNPKRDFRRHFDVLWYSHTPGSSLTFKFKGTTASILNLMGPDTGQVRVTVDGKVLGVRRQVDAWAYFQRLSALTIASGLSDEPHTVRLELLPDAPNRSVAVAAAKKAKRYDLKAFDGVAVRLGYIRMMGEPLDQ